MKTVVYIVDGVFQVILTPETDFEIEAIKELTKSKTKTDIYNGTFYTCMGGWYRQVHSEVDSLIIRTVKDAD